MKRQQPSIFNDIVGPIMVGPSSSHTCAPSRIGYLSQQILPGKLKEATIAFAYDGAYTHMYKGQRSDLGYVNGLLGRRPEDPRLPDAFAEARASGVSVSFIVEDFKAIVPNISHLTLTDEDGNTIVVHSDSTGGGTVKLLSIDGFETDITGDCYEILVFTDSGEKATTEVLRKLQEMLPLNEGITHSYRDGKGFVNYKLNSSCPNSYLESITEIDHVVRVLQLEPILAVASNRHAELPFTSAEEMLSLAKKTGQELWELGVEYEMSRSGWSRDKVLDYMVGVVEIMERSSKEALREDVDMAGIIEPSASKVESFVKKNKKALDMGVLNTAIPWAMATMEYSSAQGVVLCAPTGGSAGVFPGAVLGIAETLGLSTEEKIRAMFVTSILGIVMSKDCNYSAELYGCQVEPGAASGMAAGALVWLMGGTPEQSCMAASCAVQNILGTICDPLAGLVQVPCINRNANAVANAVLSANLIMGGFDPLIPLDQTAETLFRVGRQLPSELRCTCKGGLCITPMGQQLAREQDERDARR